MTPGIKVDFDQFHKFVDAISDKHVVKVGIFGNKSARGEAGNFSKKLGTRHKTKEQAHITNPELGAIHEFGSFARGIPARSFLKMPITVKANQILKEASQGALRLLLDNRPTLILKRLGIACEKAIQEAFASRGFGRWLPDNVATAERKHSNSPLIDTAQLRRSISSKVDTR